MKRIIFLFGLLILTSCAYNELTVCETDGPSFSECIMPIFTDNCISCHFYENPYGIMPLTNYTEIKDKIIIVTSSVLKFPNEPGFMPKSGERLSAKQILIIEKWYKNGTPNN